MHASKDIYNLNKLIKIELRGFRQCTHFTYVPYKEKKFLWFKSIRQEGYEDLFSSIYTQQELESGEYFDGVKLVFKDKIPYYRPYVNFIFEKEINKIKVFDTYEAAEQFVEEVLKNGKFDNIVTFKK